MRIIKTDDGHEVECLSKWLKVNNARFRYKGKTYKLDEDFRELLLPVTAEDYEFVLFLVQRDGTRESFENPMLLRMGWDAKCERIVKVYKSVC